MIKYFRYERFNSLTDYIDVLEAKYADRVALREKKNGDWVGYTYARLCNDVRAAAHHLHKNIHCKHIAIIGEASYMWVVSAFAAICSRGVFIPIDKELPVANMKVLLQKSEADIIILSDTYAHLENELKANIPILSMQKFELSIAMSENVKGWIENDIPPETLAAIVFTSGTTGEPKGVTHSHGNIAAMIKSSAQIANFGGRLLYLIPIHHILGFEITISTYLLAGAEIYINDSLQHLLKNIKDSKPTEILLVPALMEGFYKMYKADLSQMREGLGGAVGRLISGGAPLPVYLEEELPEKAGISVVNGYGLTECTPISVNGVVEYAKGSVGYHSEFCEYAIADDGEILVSGEIVTTEYYKDPETTAEAFVEKQGRRWFKTGDLGRIDKAGFLYITGRKKNLIILSNGENVSPEELEGLIRSKLAYVKETLVYEENDKIMAEVFPDPDTAPVDDEIKKQIFELNRGQLLYKQFGGVVIRRTEFPKNPMNKIIRNRTGE